MSPHLFLNSPLLAWSSTDWHLSSPQKLSIYVLWHQSFAFPQVSRSFCSFGKNVTWIAQTSLFPNIFLRRCNLQCQTPWISVCQHIYLKLQQRSISWRWVSSESEPVSRNWSPRSTSFVQKKKNLDRLSNLGVLSKDYSQALSSEYISKSCFWYDDPGLSWSDRCPATNKFSQAWKLSPW